MKEKKQKRERERERAREREIVLTYPFLPKLLQNFRFCLAPTCPLVLTLYPQTCFSEFFLGTDTLNLSTFSHSVTPWYSFLCVLNNYYWKNICARCAKKPNKRSCWRLQRGWRSKFLSESSSILIPAYAGSECAGESAHQCRLAWAFVVQQCDTYRCLMYWLNFQLDHHKVHVLLYADSLL